VSRLVKRERLQIEGGKIEPRLSKAFLKAMRKVRGSISIYELTGAIQSKDIKRAMALIKKSVIQDALTPCVKILADATAKGGRVSAERVNG